MRTVSVIITTYNAEKTIGRLIDSVKNQDGLGTDFTIEWLVVDDCSTDKTQQILKKKNISFDVNKKNSGGPNTGRNKALEKVSGDFITIADDDDEWKPNKLKCLLQASNYAQIVSSGYEVVDEEKGENWLKVNTCDKIQTYKTNETFRRLLQRKYSGQITYLGSLFFSSEIAIPDFETTYGKADWDWVTKLFHNQKSAEVCQPLYTRFIDGTNLSLNEQYRQDELKHSLQTLNKFQTKYPQLAAKGKQNAFGSMARYYYRMEDMSKARTYFRKSGLNLKTVLYYATSYYGYKFVNKHFKVFG